MRTLYSKRRRGHALVEFGLVGVTSFALLVSAFDFSRAIFSRAAVRHAVRVGVRFAATGKTLANQSQDSSIRTQVKANSFGLLSGPSADSLIKIRYYDRLTGAATSSNAQRNLVEVAVEGLELTPIAPLLRTAQTISMDMTAVGAVEPYPGTPPTR